MEISHLQILSTLLSDPNLTRAAQKLRMTQSALSKRVKAIEEEVGCPLFERRGPKGLKPLPQAHDFAQLADRVALTWNSGVKRILSGSAEPHHFLLIGPELFLREMILPWWNRHAKQFPLLQLEVKASSISKVSIETLRAGADAAVLEHKEELDDYVCNPLYSERWGVVLNPSKRLPTLADYKWGTPSLRDNPVELWLVRRQKMAHPNYRIVWNDLTALALWLAETPGAASVLPWHAVASLVKAGRLNFEPLQRHQKEGGTSSLFLAYQKTNPHRRFIEALGKAADFAL